MGHGENRNSIQIGPYLPCTGSYVTRPISRFAYFGTKSCFYLTSTSIFTMNSMLFKQQALYGLLKTSQDLQERVKNNIGST